MSSRPPQPMSEGESAPGLEDQPPVLDTAQDMGSAGPQTAVDMEQAPISAAVLLPLLRRLKIEVEHGALDRACDQVRYAHAGSKGSGVRAEKIYGRLGFGPLLSAN